MTPPATQPQTLNVDYINDAQDVLRQLHEALVNTDLRDERAFTMRAGIIGFQIRALLVSLEEIKENLQ